MEAFDSESWNQAILYANSPSPTTMTVDSTPLARMAKFKNPSANATEQYQSPLLRLPAEIRSMILKLLLVHMGPLRTREPSARFLFKKASRAGAKGPQVIEPMGPEMSNSFNLQPAILATCKTLFAEGRPLLYDLNIPAILLYDGGVHMYALHGIVYQNWPKPNTDAIAPLLTNFQNIHIDVTTTTDRISLKDSILLMTQILSGKDIRLEFIDQHVKGFYNSNAEMEQRLKQFMLLRCRTLDVLNAKVPKSAVSRVVDVVTSSRSILNLWKPCERVRKYYTALSNKWTYAGEYQDTFHDEHDLQGDSENAALDFDAAKFIKLRARMMKEIDDEYKEITTGVFEHDDILNQWELSTNAVQSKEEITAFGSVSDVGF